MKLKKLLALVLCIAMVLSTMSFTVFAEEATTVVKPEEPAALSYAEFNEIIRNAQDGVYDGNDITVVLKDSERSYQNNKTAQFFIGATNINITDPVAAVKVSNVNFVFEDDDTTNTYTSGELQVFADVIEFTDCTFKGVAVSPWGVSNSENAESATFTGCVWNDLSGRYGVHQNRASVLTVTGCEFINCERGIHTNSSTVSSITITDNTFTGIGAEYGVLCIAEGNGDLSKATLDISGNKAENQVMLRQLSETITYEQVADILDENKNTFGETYVSGSIELLAPVEVTTYDQLIEALEGEADTIIMMNDIVAKAKPLSNAYGKTGINILNGETLDGKGHTLTLSGLGSKWDSAINITGGTIKNLKVNKGFRGIFINHNSTYGAHVYLENVIIDGPTYTISCDQGTNNGLTATGCTFNGWTSFAKTLGKATFNNCNFGEGSGYSFCRPYAESEFNGCDFEKDYEFDANQIGSDIHEFNECKYDGEDLGAGNGMEMFYNGGNITIDGEQTTLAKNPVANIGLTTFATLKEAVEAAKDGDTIYITGKVNEETVKLPAKIKDLTIAGATDGAMLKDSTIMAADGNSINYDGLTIKNLTFDNSRISLTGWRTNGASIKNLVVENNTFKNLDDTTSSAPVHINMAETEAVNGFTFTNNIIDGATGGSKSGIYAQVTGNAVVKNNVINNVAFRPFVIQLTTDDGIDDSFIVEGNTFSNNASGRLQGLGNNAAGTDSVNLVITNNIIHNVPDAQEICYWNFNPETTTATFSYNYFGADIIANPSQIYFNSSAADVDALINMGIFPFYEELNEDGTINTDSLNNGEKLAKAMIGNSPYTSIQKAVDAAEAGDIITVLDDITEKVVIAAPAVATLAANDDAIVIDLNGNTLYGYILIEDPTKVIEIKNGNIVNEDSAESAIESKATLTVTDVNIVSARGAINIEGGNAEINGGNYSLIQKEILTQNVIGAENANVTINDGVFTGPAGTTADSGAAVAAKTGSTVEIYGGKFSGGKNNTLSAKGTLVVYGGMFDQDPAAYIAETSEAVDRGAYEYPYGVAPKAAAKINVALKATDNKNVYNIVITSADEYDINEFVSAELTFKNESTTVGGSVMDYKINGYADNKTFAQEAKDAVGLKDNEEQYIISLNDGAKRLSSTDAKDGDGIIIGQVEFFGQGDIKFSVTKGEVDTTWQNTNLGRYYTTEVVAPATEATLGIENASINSNVPEVHRDVAVNVAFNHNIDTNDYWEGYQIEVTLKNSAMGKEYKKTLEIKDIKSGACVFEDVPVGYITVTLKAPGFRTYTYNTTLEETKDNGVLVLNFWNDVKKGNDEAIEKGKDKMAHNFLVGDIVMDMKVDKYDLAAVTSYYGTYGIDKAEAEKYIKYDLNRDGDIDIRDVQYVLHTMGN